MQANELRIGNWYFQFDMYRRASWVTIKDLVDAPKSQLWCKPIPLTPEILHAAGFKSSFTSDPQEPNPSLVYKLGGLEIYQPKERANNFYYFAYEIDVQIHSLHQLTNLYFALTQTELYIKL